jgi:hypothetical protein
LAPVKSIAESPRVLRRLFFLRNWSHHEQETSPQIPG